MIEVMESALQKAAGEGMDEFIQVFTDKYKEIIGGELTADTMPLLQVNAFIAGLSDFSWWNNVRRILSVDSERLWRIYLW